MGEVKRFGEYWDSFSVLPMDANNDGWTDFIYGGCQKFVKNIISYGIFGVGKGTGIQMAIIDLQGKDKKDIVVAGKDGLFIFWNE